MNILLISGDRCEIETKPDISCLATASHKTETSFTSWTPSSSGSTLKSSSSCSGSSLSCLGNSDSSLTSNNASWQVSYVASSSGSNLSIPSSGSGSLLAIPNAASSPKSFNIAMPYTEEEEAWINQQFQMIEDIFR